MSETGLLDPVLVFPTQMMYNCSEQNGSRDGGIDFFPF